MCLQDARYYYIVNIHDRYDSHPRAAHLCPDKPRLSLVKVQCVALGYVCTVIRLRKLGENSSDILAR